MEQNPFHSSENAANGESKDSKKSDKSGSAEFAERPSYEAPRVERPVVPLAPALERVISLWDRQDDEVHRHVPEKPAVEKDNDDEVQESNKKDKATIKPAYVPRQPFPPMVEAQPSQPEEDKEITSAEQIVQGESRVGPIDEGDRSADEIHVPRQAAPTRPSSNAASPLPPIVSPAAPDVSRPSVERLQVQTYSAGYEAPPVLQPNANAYPFSGRSANAEAFPVVPAEGWQSVAEDDVPVPPPKATGSVPPMPPASQHVAFSANQSSNPNLGFANQYVHPGVTSYDTVLRSPDAMPTIAPVMPIEHPLQTYNRDPGARQAAAVLGGLWWLERRGRKKADQRLERANEHTEKLLGQQGESMASGQRQIQEHQRQLANEQIRQTTEVNRMRESQERFAAPPVPPSERFDASMARRPDSVPNTGPVFGPEGRQQHLFERPMKVPEQPPVSVSEAEQGIHLRPHEHVQHSTWHNIVVDERGREVAGAIHYGEGFRRERQQEIIRDRMGGGGSSAQGTAGQYQQGQSYPMYPGALPSGMTNPALPQGQPTHVDPQHQLESSNKAAGNLNNPWLWIMVILIIVVFFTAALI